MVNVAPLTAVGGKLGRDVIGLGLMIALAVTMGFDKDWNQSWIVGVPWLILLTIAYFIWKRARFSE